MNTDLTPQGRYDHLMHKVVYLKSFEKAFKLAFDIFAADPKNKAAFLKTGNLNLKKSLLGNIFFTVDAKNMTYLEPVYENWLNKNGWAVSYKNFNDANGITTFVCLKPIKPIKKIS